MKSDVADLSYAEMGRRRIDWAAREMPVLALIQARFEAERPFEQLTVAACLHVTTETARLMQVLRAGGANVRLCASNPLSTQDDVAAALVDQGIPVFAKCGEDKETYYEHIRAVLSVQPNVTLDDGADLITTIHGQRSELLRGILGGTEETTTGVTRLRAMERDAALRYPVIAVNDAMTKHLFDESADRPTHGRTTAISAFVAGRHIAMTQLPHRRCAAWRSSRFSVAASSLAFVPTEPR